MNAIFFGLKRAYWGSIRMLRRPLLTLGMTAARLDLMYAVHGSPIGLEQRELMKILGVSRTVVSRMVRSLAALGWLERSPGADRRTWQLDLTDAGRALMATLLRSFVRSKGIARLIDRALEPKRHRNAAACFWAWCNAEEVFRRIRARRAGFGGGGTLFYPWHPDD